MESGIDRIGALSKALEFIYKSESNGSYCEFGVYQGVSLARALKVNSVWQRRTGRSHIDQFFGFDSFEGLPVFTENDQLNKYEVFQEGQFNDTSIEQVRKKITDEGSSLDGVELIPGLFSETLFSPCIGNKIPDESVVIAHIDCDLYSSAVDCLKFLHGRLADGAVILFDDWFCYRGCPERGVHKAFSEWKEEMDYSVSEYFNYSWAGKAFIINYSR